MKTLGQYWMQSNTSAQSYLDKMLVSLEDNWILGYAFRFWQTILISEVLKLHDDYVSVDQSVRHLGCQRDFDNKTIAADSVRVKERWRTYWW